DLDRRVVGDDRHTSPVEFSNQEQSLLLRRWRMSSAVLCTEVCNKRSDSAYAADGSSCSAKSWVALGVASPRGASGSWALGSVRASANTVAMAEALDESELT